MERSIRAYTKTRRPEQKGTLVGVRLQPDLLRYVDAWIIDQPLPRPTRPEAVRRLIELGLASQGGTAMPHGRALEG